MIGDAGNGHCDFRTILVYDIKRFGRVDNDEAATTATCSGSTASRSSTPARGSPATTPTRSSAP